MLSLVGAIMVAGALFYIVFSTMQAMESSQAEDRLNLEIDSEGKKSFRPPFYIAFTKPLLKGAYLDMAVGFWKPEQLANHKRKLISAGLGRYIEAEHFVASKFWLTLIVGFFLLMLFAFGEDPPPLYALFGIILLTFFLPNLHVKGLRDNRQLEVRFAMPYVVDLLTLSMEAGLDFLGAVSKVVDRARPSPLIEELQTLLKDIQLGKTRGEGLKSMAQRIDMKEMSSFVAVIVSADQMGASIGNALRGQSDSMRNERLARAEKLGAQASQKILIPLVFFILPAVMLMVFGPIILSMLGVK